MGFLELLYEGVAIDVVSGIAAPGCCQPQGGSQVDLANAGGGAKKHVYHRSFSTAAMCNFISPFLHFIAGADSRIMNSAFLCCFPDVDKKS